VAEPPQRVENKIKGRLEPGKNLGFIRESTLIESGKNKMAANSNFKGTVSRWSWVANNINLRMICADNL